MKKIKKMCKLYLIKPKICEHQLGLGADLIDFLEQEINEITEFAQKTQFELLAFG